MRINPRCGWKIGVTMPKQPPPTICKDLSSISILLGLWKSSWSHSGHVSQGIGQQNSLTPPIIGLLSWCFLQAYFTPSLPSQVAAQACHIARWEKQVPFLFSFPIQSSSCFSWNQTKYLLYFWSRISLCNTSWPRSRDTPLPLDLAVIIDVYHTLAPNKISSTAFIAPSPILCHCPGTWFKQVLNNIQVEAEFFSLIKHWVWETLKLFHTKSI